MEIDPGSVLTEQLLDQRMANDALLMINNDERNLSLLHRIDAFMASTDEVKQWFFALDPLDERLGACTFRPALPYAWRYAPREVVGVYGDEGKDCETYLTTV